MKLEAKQRLMAADPPFIAKFLAIIKASSQSYTIAVAGLSRVSANITSGGGALAFDQLALAKLAKLCKEFDGSVSVVPRGASTTVTFRIREEDIQAKKRA